jgi:hypothetical protein
MQAFGGSGGNSSNSQLIINNQNNKLMQLNTGRFEDYIV